jgi:hypothetical protein
MKLVRQEKLGECGAACLAMVVGSTLDAAREFLGDASRGTVSTDLIDALAKAGVPSIESIKWPSYSIPAILTVPSLNHPGLLHFIVWDGEKYLDPSNEAKRYPDDSPNINGHVLPPSWATVILLWPRVRR